MPAGCGAKRDPPEKEGCGLKRKAGTQDPPAPCFSRKSSEGRLEADLRYETVKWQKKAQDLYENVSGDDQFLENVSAYIRDCQYFLEKDDLIRSFEAIIWAWSWMEIGLQKGFLRESA